MRFYFAPNTISIATAYVLEETGLEYEPVRVDFGASEQTGPDYLAINPKGRVPALVTENGILTETGAILEYLATQAPGARLVPSHPWDAAQMRSVMYYLASTMHVNHAHRMRGHRWADRQSSFEDMTAKVPETMGQSCTFLEENTVLAPYVTGAEMSLADPYLFAICTWLEGDGVDIRNYPRLAAHFSMMSERPAAAALRDIGLLT